MYLLGRLKWRWIGLRGLEEGKSEVVEGLPFLNGSVCFDINDVSDFVLSQIRRELDHALLLEVS